LALLSTKLATALSTFLTTRRPRKGKFTIRSERHIYSKAAKAGGSQDWVTTSPREALASWDKQAFHLQQFRSLFSRSKSGAAFSSVAVIFYGGSPGMLRAIRNSSSNGCCASGNSNCSRRVELAVGNSPLTPTIVSVCCVFPSLPMR
jgi:hypothetical protein